MGTPFFVTEINPETNQVVIGSKEQLAKPGLSANEANWLVEPQDLPRQVSVQIRYNAPPQPAQIVVNPNDETRFSAVFDEPQFAVAPGQAAVVYDETRVLGGGWIE
jgi:tRNA-specific 2-thiouridylase